ncbi:MAG: cytochrome C oxidase subunit IV family protein [bacterium]
MSAHTQAHGQGHDHDHGHERHYVKIWAILLVLLVISVIGPFVGERFHMPWITLLTAFGIAAVKAWLVAKHFMHIDVEQPIIRWIMVTGVALMVLLYGALAPDIQHERGQRWEKDAGWHNSIRPNPKAHGEHGEASKHGGASHGGETPSGSGH